MNKLRYEYKYILPVQHIENFINSITPYVYLDKFAEMHDSNEYVVRSVYFDSQNFEAYNEKIEGIKNRKKIRVRVYNDYDEKAAAFLEIKRKFENHILKNRAKIDYKKIDKFFNSDPAAFSFKSSDDLKNANMFLFNVKTKNMKPVILISYNRLAYFSKFNSLLRITIDKNLRSMINPGLSDIYNEENLSPSFENKSILEIKFLKGFPNWLTEIIRAYNLNRYALSKYTICLDSQRSPVQKIIPNNFIINNSIAMNNA